MEASRGWRWNLPFFVFTPPLVRRQKRITRSSASKLSKVNFLSFLGFFFLLFPNIFSIRKHFVLRVGDDSFDFFLPQICVMLITWEPARCASLERFFLEKCMNSIHFALKSFWYIHASMEYTKSEGNKVLEGKSTQIVEKRSTFVWMFFFCC